MKIKFKNFKTFKSLHEINVKPLSIIIGKNNSGKSTVSDVIKYYTLLKNSYCTNSLLSPTPGIRNFVNIDSLKNFSGVKSLVWTIETPSIDPFVEINDIPDTIFYEPLFALKGIDPFTKEKVFLDNQCIMTIPDTSVGEGSVFYYKGIIKEKYFEYPSKKMIRPFEAISDLILNINFADQAILEHEYQTEMKKLIERLKKDFKANKEFKDIARATSEIEDFNNFISENYISSFNYEFSSNHNNEKNQIHFLSSENPIVNDLIVEIDRNEKIPNKVYYKADSLMFKKINKLIDSLCAEAFKSSYTKYKKIYPDAFEAINYISSNRYYYPPSRSSRFDKNYFFDSLLKHEANTEIGNGINNIYSKSIDNLILGYKDKFFDKESEQENIVVEAKRFGSIKNALSRSIDFPKSWGPCKVTPPEISDGIDKVILGHSPVKDDSKHLIYNSQENQYILDTNNDIKVFEQQFNEVRSIFSKLALSSATWNDVVKTLETSIILLKISENIDKADETDFSYVGIPFSNVFVKRTLDLIISSNKQSNKESLKRFFDVTNNHFETMKKIYINEPNLFLEYLRISVEDLSIDKSLFPKLFDEDTVALKYLKENPPLFETMIPVKASIKNVSFTDDEFLEFPGNFIILNHSLNSEFEKKKRISVLQYVDETIQEAVDSRNEDFVFDSFLLASDIKKITSEISKNGYKTIGDLISKVKIDFSDDFISEPLTSMLFGSKSDRHERTRILFSVFNSYQRVRKNLEELGSKYPFDPLYSISYNINNNSVGFRTNTGLNFERKFYKYISESSEYQQSFKTVNSLKEPGTLKDHKNQILYLSLLYHFVESSESLKIFKSNKISKLDSSGMLNFSVKDLEAFTITNSIANFKKVCFDIIYDYLCDKYFSETIFLSKNIVLDTNLKGLHDYPERVEFETTIIRPDGLTSNKIVYNLDELEGLFGEDLINPLRKDPSFSSRISQAINDKLDSIGMSEYVVVLSPFKGGVFSLEIDIKGEKMPFNSVGAGTRSLISIFGHLSGYEQLTLSKKQSSKSIHDILIIREPENFIHPSLVGQLIEYLVNFSSKYQDSGSVKIVIETHSEIILRKIQVLIKENKINSKNVGINYIEKSASTSEIIPLELKDDGTFRSELPKDFFDINTKLTRDLWSLD